MPFDCGARSFENEFGPAIGAPAGHEGQQGIATIAGGVRNEAFENVLLSTAGEFLSDIHGVLSSIFGEPNVQNVIRARVQKAGGRNEGDGKKNKRERYLLYVRARVSRFSRNVQNVMGNVLWAASYNPPFPRGEFINSARAALRRSSSWALVLNWSNTTASTCQERETGP
jgi:hypothetical protein